MLSAKDLKCCCGHLQSDHYLSTGKCFACRPYLRCDRFREDFGPICFNCGSEVGRAPRREIGYWMGTCAICGKEKALAAHRDFGYPPLAAMKALRDKLRTDTQVD